LGYPLGEPNNPELRKSVILAALALLAQPVKLRNRSQSPLVRDQALTQRLLKENPRGRVESSSLAH